NSSNRMFPRMEAKSPKAMLEPRRQDRKLGQSSHLQVLQDHRPASRNHRVMLLHPLRSQTTAPQSNNKRYPMEVTQLPNRKCKSRDRRFKPIKLSVRLNLKPKMREAFLESVLKSCLVKG